MPELPEVETVCRVLRHALQGERIAHVKIEPDSIVFADHTPQEIEKALRGRTVKEVGRRGKFFWLRLDGQGPTLFAHLGMSGWVREVAGAQVEDGSVRKTKARAAPIKEGTRLHGHGKAPFDDPQGRPRFFKLGLATSGGNGVVFTDPRRLGRIWLGPSPEQDSRVKRLGRDAFDDLPTADELLKLLGRRKIPIKAVLLDQSALAGIGNWIADEVLYQARIAPKRSAASLSATEVASLRRAIRSVLAKAVTVGANHELFPKSWLFEHRWGGARGAERVGGQRIVREEVGGRTTAWVPTRQK